MSEQAVSSTRKTYHPISSAPDDIWIMAMMAGGKWKPGVRRYLLLKRQGEVWIAPEGGEYPDYFTPTHWRPVDQDTIDRVKETVKRRTEEEQREIDIRMDGERQMRKKNLKLLEYLRANNV